MPTTLDRPETSRAGLPEELQRLVDERTDSMSDKELTAWTKKRKKFDASLNRSSSSDVRERD
jgi:hypothetical protein